MCDALLALVMGPQFRHHFEVFLLSVSPQNELPNDQSVQGQVLFIKRISFHTERKIKVSE